MWYKNSALAYQLLNAAFHEWNDDSAHAGKRDSPEIVAGIQSYWALLRVAEDLAGFTIALVSPEVASACFQYLLRPEGVQPAPVHRLR